MGKCCGKHERKKTEELDPTKTYVDVHLHDVHTIGVDLSLRKSDQKMGVETVCTGKLTHDRDLEYKPHVNFIPKVMDLLEEEINKENDKKNSIEE